MVSPGNGATLGPDCAACEALRTRRCGGGALARPARPTPELVLAAQRSGRRGVALPEAMADFPLQAAGRATDRWFAQPPRGMLRPMRTRVLAGLWLLAVGLAPLAVADVVTLTNGNELRGPLGWLALAGLRGPSRG